MSDASLTSPRRRRGLSHMTELRRALIGRGLVQSLSRSSLRTQGPITPGLKSEKSLCSSAETRVRAVWVPAFAGTTCWKIPYAIALPQAGRGEGSELILPDGQISDFAVQPHLQKYFCSGFTQITSISSTVSSRKRAVSRSSRTRGGMGWTRQRRARAVSQFEFFVRLFCRKCSTAPSI